MQRLWPDSFVEEANLTQNIYTLRKALGGDYIQTIPRRGYRFVADVKEADDPQADVIVIKERTRTSVSYEEGFDPGEQVLTGNVENGSALLAANLRLPAAKSRYRRYAWIAAPLIAACVLIIAGWLWLRRTPAPFATVKLSKFTTTGKAVKVAISPDGKYVSFVLNDAVSRAYGCDRQRRTRNCRLLRPKEPISMD